MKIGDMDSMLDLIADEDTQVEFQQETGFKDRFKLYIHVAGRTVVRVCKLKREQIETMHLR